MEISPEGKDSIRSALCQFMSEDEAERFMNLEYAIGVIKQGQSCWQAPVSIGIHAVVLCLNAKAEDDKAALPNLIGLSLEPLEALLERLLAKPDEETLTDERARMLVPYPLRAWPLTASQRRGGAGQYSLARGSWYPGFI